MSKTRFRSKKCGREKPGVFSLTNGYSALATGRELPPYLARVPEPYALIFSYFKTAAPTALFRAQ